MNPVRRATIQAIKESGLPLRQRTQLRLAVAFKGDEIDEVVQEALEGHSLSLPMPQPEGSFGGPDWATILKFFIENILPLLLKLL